MLQYKQDAYVTFCPCMMFNQPNIDLLSRIKQLILIKCMAG